MGFSRLLLRPSLRCLCRHFSTGGTLPTPKPSQSLNSDIRALFKETDPDALVARFKELSSTSHPFRCNANVYHGIVRRLSAYNRPDAVADILDAQKVTPSITHEGFAARLISLYGKAGLGDSAADTFRQLPSLGCNVSVLSFNVLLSALSDAGEHVRAIDAFYSVPLENQDIVPDLFSYNAAIFASCEKGDPDGAMEFYAQMMEKDIEPNVVTYTSLLSGLYKNGRWEDADKLWAAMRAKNCTPDVKCYNLKIRVLATEGRNTEANEVLEEMRSIGVEPDGYTYTGLIMGCCKAGDLDSAMKVFAEMRNTGCEPNRGTFEALVPQLCETGEVNLALKLCRESLHRRCAVGAEVLQTVAERLMEASREEDARKLIELAWEKGFSKDSLRISLACVDA